MSSIRRVLVVVLFFALVPAGTAQSGRVPGLDQEENPLVAMQALARAKRKAVQSSSKELALAKLETARTYYDHRWQEYLSGKTTSASLTAASQLLLEAEQGVHPKNPDALAVSLEQNWRRAKEHELVAEARYQAGSVSDTFYLEVVYQRLLAELAWARIRKDPAKKPGRLPGKLDDPLEEGPLQFQQREARDQRAALLATPQKLAAQLLEVARSGAGASFKEYVSGKTTTDSLEVWLERLSKAERHREGNTGTAVLEKWYSATWEVLRIDRAKYEAGSIALHHYACAKYFYLDAGRELASAAPGKTSGSSFWPGSGGEETGDLSDSWIRELAGARLALKRSSVKTLTAARYAAAAEAVEDLTKAYISGRTVPGYLLEWSVRLLEAERTLDGNKVHQMRAYADHWRRTWEIETDCRAKYEAGSISTANYAVAIYYRLDAELQWAQARAVLP